MTTTDRYPMTLCDYIADAGPEDQTLWLAAAWLHDGSCKFDELGQAFADESSGQCTAQPEEWQAWLDDRSHDIHAFELELADDAGCSAS
jgi:hypothetical protein